jgi:tetratricopeptide (TPR) repeat protein
MSDDLNESPRQQAQALILQQIRQQREGREVSDGEMFDAHPHLRGELQRAIANARALSMAFVKAEGAAEPSVRPDSRASISCPVCHAPLAASETVAKGDTIESVCGSCGRQVTIRQEPNVDHVAHFELIDRLGSGGFGTVWRALDTKLDREVAVKIASRIGSSFDAEDAFLREAKAAARLAHPNIVATYEVGRDGTTDYIACELIDGMTLKERFDQRRFGAHEAADICRKISEAVHYAHEEGVIHRDLKPQNILLDIDGEPHIADFGLARRDASEITVTIDGQIVGTPAYMSPEQALGDSRSAGRRSDVYSIGVVLFELLTGEVPFRGSLPAVVRQVATAVPPRPRSLQPRIPRDLETICLKCLEKRPELRYPTAAALADDLSRFLATEPIKARPVGYVGRSVRWCQRSPAVASLLVLLLLAISAGFAGILWQWRDATQSLWLANQAEQRAQENLFAADRVVEDFLITVSENTLLNEPYMEQLRSHLLEMGTDYYQDLVTANVKQSSVALRSALARSKLGILHAKMGRREKALQELDLALETLLDLQHAGGDARVIHDHFYEVLTRKGDALRALVMSPNPNPAPLECYLEAQQHFERGSLNYQDTPRLQATLQTKLAQGYAFARRYGEAVQANQMAIGLWQAMTDEDPDDIDAVWSLATRHIELAGQYNAMLNYAAAPPHHERGIELLRQVVAKDPQPRYRSDLAAALYASQTKQDSISETHQAIPILEEAIAIRVELARQFPTIRKYQTQTLTNLCLLGNTQIKSGDTNSAQANFDRMLAITDRLESQEPDNVETRVYRLNALFHKALAHQTARESKQAIEVYQAVSRMADEITANDPTRLQARIIHSATERKLAALSSAADNNQAAQQHYQNALDVSYATNAHFPNDVMSQQMIVMGHEELARFMLDKDVSAAKEQAQRGLDFAGDLRQRSSGEFGWLDEQSMRLQYCMGHAALKEGRYPEAIERLQQVIEVSRERLEMDRGASHLLAAASGSLAESHLRTGGLKLALEAIEDAADALGGAADRLHLVAAMLDRSLLAVTDDELLTDRQRSAFVANQTARATELFVRALEAGFDISRFVGSKKYLPFLREHAPDVVRRIDDKQNELAAAEAR